MAYTRTTQVSNTFSIAGNLKNYNQSWKDITSDKWIQDTVSNCHIEFETQPCQLYVPKELKFSEKEKTVVSAEVQDLLKKGAIEKAEHPGFLLKF